MPLKQISDFLQISSVTCAIVYSSLFLYFCNQTYHPAQMCTQKQCIERITEAAPKIKNQFGVRSLCLFGSMARGDNRPDSDVDICVDMPPKAFAVLALKRFLQDLLGISVDLVRRHANMDEFLINEIERDGIYLIS